MLTQPEPQFLMLAASTPSGVAGHHYSVRDITGALDAAGVRTELCLILNRPGQSSRALDGMPHVQVDAGFCFLEAIAFVRRRLSDNPALVVFGYDELSVRIAIASTIGQRHRIVSVKPGWINSASWSDGVANFILFTRENLDFYARHPRYAGVALHYLPNRVARPDPAPDAAVRLGSLLPGFGSAGPSIFCPVRLGWGKAFIVDQAFRLHDAMKSSGQPAGLVIAGTAHDQSYVQSLRDRIAGMPDVWMTTDPGITGNISAYMNAFDIVIGAGRTSGEALCLGKRVFCPDPDSELPVEITPRSYEGLAYSNFTGRVAAAEGGAREAPDCDLSVLVAERLGVEAGVPLYRRIAADALRARLGLARALRTWVSTMVRLVAIYTRTHLGGVAGASGRRAAKEGQPG
ncbi:hypothetical protein [Emcibacter sp. SYSU 3D8]|uniref:hypothetical protein n=1 Tax=Emcibacter sp. SYSU 3D8 TaxID=3133969 RepID=UPI0031FE8763